VGNRAQYALRIDATPLTRNAVRLWKMTPSGAEWVADVTKQGALSPNGRPWTDEEMFEVTQCLQSW
jgi:hypothetical protein